MSSPDPSSRRTPWDRTPNPADDAVASDRAADAPPQDHASGGAARRETPGGDPTERPLGGTTAAATGRAGGAEPAGTPGQARRPRRATGAGRAETAPRRRRSGGAAPTGGPGSAPRLRVPELSLLLLVSTALGCVGLADALSGTWWILPVAATVVTVLLVTGAARWLRLPSVLVTVLGLAALLLALTVVHLGEHALLGFVPTGETFSAASSLWQSSGDFVARDAAPYGEDPGLSFVLCALVGLVTVFMETVLVGLRMAGLACVGILTLQLVPALTLPGSVSTLGLAAAALAALALLAGSRIWGATRDRRIAPAPGGLPRALLVVAGVLAVVLLVPSVMPGFFNGAFPQGSSLTSGRASGVGPLRAVGQDLRSAEDAQRFSYTTSDGQAQYMRLLTLSDFSQDEWFPDTDGLDENLSALGGAAREAVPGGTEVTTKVTFEDYDEHWLPAPYAPAEIAGLGEDGWAWNPQDLTVHSAATGMSGASYTVTSVQPQPTPETLRQAPPASADPAMTEYLKLPPDRPQSLSDAARQFTEGAGTDYDRALALQNHLRRDFQHDVNAPLAQGYDAGGMSSMDTFMSTRTGYSGHFAPAMALMAREVGIPARVAVGYLPTAATAEDGASFAVGTGDAHAWPELYFENVGWVRFEPTPGVPSTPVWAPETPQDQGHAATSPAPDASQPEPGTSEGPGEQPSEPASEQPSDPASQQPGQSGATDETAPQEQRPAGLPLPWWAVAAAVAVPLLLVLAALPRWLRGRRRRARVRAMQDTSLTPQRRANAAWDEFRALAVDHGAASRVSDTPRARASRLAAGIPAAQPSLDRVVADLESASYGAPDPSWSPRATPEDLARIRDEFRRKASRGQRFRATWWPASLFGGSRR
ncbi:MULTISPECIES: transglutaminaseTgpA domain-containing protein [Kocuria]|uniref:transglutaminaseTgpA domain-containing protein n=1 Tax=Kocuria TaxID=57493 RepID=UPI0021A383F3|nr:MULTISPECIES: transglutaminaseTgpA domain-containing protein [Kocuria]MCT2172407.1 transglutaminaseTgpA domain-containing protein [Kocuria rhizophila]MDN3462882.1 transglutaminaseTgpA domain-containing protein [Kocuria sp. APC 4018]